MEIVTRKTIDEIKDCYRETYAGDDWEVAFNNCRTETSYIELSRFDDEDEFYTDHYHYVPVDEVAELITWQNVAIWIIESGEQEMNFCEMCPDLIRRFFLGAGINMTESENKARLIEYVEDNEDNLIAYLEWLWGQE